MHETKLYGEGWTAGLMGSTEAGPLLWSLVSLTWSGFELCPARAGPMLPGQGTALHVSAFPPREDEVVFGKERVKVI